jgi:hypothetical protein
MGGRAEFFGPVVCEPDEPTFHQRWEGRVFGIAYFLLPLIGRNLDIARFAMQRLPREIYLSAYYRRWLGAFEILLVEAGYLAPGEVDARVAGSDAQSGQRRVSKGRLAVTARALRWGLRPRLHPWFAGGLLPLALGMSRPTLRRPRYAVGEPVRVRDAQAEPFTRQPGYVTGKPGVVVAHLGATVFPDAVTTGRREGPQHLYTVAFEGADVWGADAEHGTEIRVDLYESYLEAT